MDARKALGDWLLYVGLILPAAYVCLIPGAYFAIWRQIIFSIAEGGITILILFAGLLAVFLYLATFVLAKTNIEQSRRIGEAAFAIHVAVGVSVLITISAAFVQIGPRGSAVEGLYTLYAFFATDFMIFPLIGLLYLQDIIRHHGENLASGLLLSVALYLCIAFITISNLIRLDPAFADISRLSPLEVVGARVFFLLVIFANFIRTPLFWQSASLYSFDIAPPPIWVSAVYVLTVTFFVYYHARRTRGTASEIDTSGFYTLLPLDMLRFAMTILAGIIFAFAMVSAADFVLPHNISGNVFQLFMLFLLLLLAFTHTTRKARQL